MDISYYGIMYKRLMSEVNVLPEPSDAPEKQGVWRIIKYILPLLFLFAGFFGIQIWMVMDEKQLQKPEMEIGESMPANSAKADVAKFTTQEAAVPGEKAIVVQKTKKGSEQASASKIPGMEYYRLQAGSFENQQGAEKLKKKLREMGYGSFIVNADKTSKVIVMTVFSKDQSEMLKTELEAKGVSGYTEKVSVQDAMILLEQDSTRLQGFMDASLTEIQAMLRELCDHYYIYEIQGINPKEYGALVVSQVSRISDMKTEVDNMEVGVEDRVLQEQLSAYLEEYARYLEKVGKVKKMDRTLLWPGIIERIEAYGQIEVQNKAN